MSQHLFDYPAQRPEGSVSVERPDACTCPPVLGGWDEGCPVHPLDDSWEEAEHETERRLSAHDDGCVASAVAAAFDLGHDSADSVRQVAAQILDDREVECICGGARTAHVAHKDQPPT
jgi:hypothetical protein